MSKLFKDHFSENTKDYAEFRPTYPTALFEYLSDISPEKKIAWDCATGNGQSAQELSKYFSQVLATDASASQIEQATKQQNIIYSVVVAEKTSIETGSVDLVTVAQALHWFDQEKFFLEAKRVLKPKGVLAVWSYNLLNIRPDIDEVINHFYTETLKSYWQPERRMVEQGYGEIQFPFEQIETPGFVMKQDWSCSQLLGYLRTWSAVKKYKQEKGTDPVAELSEEISALWDDPEEKLKVEWPLKIRVMV